MPKACDLKSGAIVMIDGAPHVLDSLFVQSPSARGGSSLYKMRFRNLQSKQKVDKTLKGDDFLPPANFEKREVQFLYAQNDQYAFMDLEDYTQFEIHSDDLEMEKLYLIEDLEGIYALMSEGKVLGIELPNVVEIAIVECDPSIKGSSATARTKPATLSTGLVIQVPEHISNEEVVRIDTRDGRFLGRA